MLNCQESRCGGDYVSIEDIVARYMARLEKIGAHDVFVGFDGAVIPIDVALLNYRDQLVESFADIRFHYSPSSEFIIAEGQEPFLSINPVDIKIMTTTKFPGDDILAIRTINTRSIFKSSKSYIRIGNIIDLLDNAIKELDYYENFNDEITKTNL